MLCLSRYLNESIVIGGEIVVTVIEVRGDKVRLGIDAPKDVSVNRKEVEDAIRRDGSTRRPRPDAEAIGGKEA